MHIYYTTPTTTNLIYLNGSSPVWMHIAYTNYYAMIIHAEGEKERERENKIIFQSRRNAGCVDTLSRCHISFSPHFHLKSQTKVPPVLETKGIQAL